MTDSESDMEWDYPSACDIFDRVSSASDTDDSTTHRYQKRFSTVRRERWHRLLREHRILDYQDILGGDSGDNSDHYGDNEGNQHYLSDAYTSRHALQLPRHKLRYDQPDSTAASISCRLYSSADICCICLDRLTNGPCSYCAHSCGNCFHSLCIDHLRDNKCPICRRATIFKSEKKVHVIEIDARPTKLVDPTLVYSDVT
jgi:hypothetical protein